MNDYKDNITLVVSSCDKYSDAWYPYFELIKKYWPEHPEKICLITETKQYSCDGLDIKTFNYDQSLTWSERLYRSLEKIDTKYIIFSLEDFFLLDYVKQDKIEKCYTWMEENEKIAVCRLYSCDYGNLKPTGQYDDFYMADSSIGYRLDTQVALWNKKTLMSFIDLKESPWQFETLGTQRIKKTDKIFLWHHTSCMTDTSDKIFPYLLQKYGYGISWGHWLWNNRRFFEKNGITDVNFRRLGVLSERAAGFRFKHLYNNNPNFIDKIMRPFMRSGIRLRKVFANFRIYGLKKGLKESWKSK